MGKFKGIAGVKKDQKRKFCPQRHLFFDYLSQGKAINEFFYNIMTVSLDEIIKEMHDIGTLHVQENLSLPLESLPNRGVSLNRELF